MSSLAYTISDTVVIAKRNLLRIPRQPDLLIAYTIQPVMFIVLFVYVFGGAISTPGYDYVDFLMPGIITQSIAFGGFVTAIGLNEDLRKGLIDRFRSLPMARSAVLAGRTIADIVLNAFSLTVMIAVGYVVGFNFSSPAYEVVVGIILLLLFGYGFSWFFALMGMVASSPESAQSVGFLAIFPLTFASSAFVPTDSMPSWLEAFANVNPFTIVVNAVRALWIDAPAGNYVWGAFAWSIRDDPRLRSARRPRVPPRRGPGLALQHQLRPLRPTHPSRPRGTSRRTAGTRSGRPRAARSGRGRATRGSTGRGSPGPRAAPCASSTRPWTPRRGTRLPMWTLSVPPVTSAGSSNL